MTGMELTLVILLTVFTFSPIAWIAYGTYKLNKWMDRVEKTLDEHKQ